MSVCDDIRPELPGYVSGSLDELQRNVVEGHLKICADCRREADEINDLSALLSIAAVEHQPPEDLEEQVFGFIEHLPEADLVATAAVEHTPPEDLERKSLQRAGVLAGTKSWWDRNATRLSPVLAAASLVFAAMGMNWRGDAQTSQAQITSLEGHYGKWGQPMGSVDLLDTGATSDAEVSAQVVDFQQQNYRVVFYTDKLPPTEPGYRYEVWLVGDQGRVSCGSFVIDHIAELSFPFTVGVNPLDYPTLEVTLEPNDGGPGADGDVVLEAVLAGATSK